MKEFINSLWGKKAGKAAIGILAALFIIGGGVTLYERHEAKLAAQTLTLNGNVDLREVSLAFKNSDRIAEILVEEGDAVKKDQVLARLDSDALQYKVKIAEAQVAAQQAVVDKLHNGTRRNLIRLLPKPRKQRRIEIFSNVNMNASKRLTMRPRAAQSVMNPSMM